MKKSSTFMYAAHRAASTAPKFRAQLPVGVVGEFSVSEPFTDGSDIIRNFDDEFMASQCALHFGTRVERHDKKDFE